jgi:hypothetical protein
MADDAKAASVPQVTVPQALSLPAKTNSDAADAPSERDAPKMDPVAICRQLLDGAEVSIVKPIEFFPVFKQLTVFRESRVGAHDRDGAEHADRILQQLQQLRVQAMRQTMREDRENEYRQRLAAARQSATDLESRYDRLQQLIVDENAEHVRQLEERQQAEREEYPTRWEAPQKTRIYSRASNTLITLRTQSYLLMKARRYDDQRVAERYVGELEAHEAMEQSRNISIDFDNGIALLAERQKTEMSHLLMANQSRLRHWKVCRDREIAAAWQRVQNIENEMKIAKEQDRFLGGYESGGSRRRTKSRSARKPPTIDMLEICTIKLPPLSVSLEQRKNKVRSSIPTRM